MKDFIKTKIIKVNPNNIDYNVIKEASEIINNGGTVVFPTETVYGIGADALNDEAVKKIFLAKNRPQDNPLIVHISEIEQLYNLSNNITKDIEKLVSILWPGPLTIIVDKNELLSYIISAGLETVAIRMPQNPIALALIKESKKPIAAPSANLSGKPSPTEASHVIDDLMGRVDMIIDGGDTSVGIESTVLDMTADIPLILRPGKVTRDDIVKILGKCEYDMAITKSDEHIVPKSPGQKYTHYSPNAKVRLYLGDSENIAKQILVDYKVYESSGNNVGILSTIQTNDFYEGCRVICLGDRNNPITISSELFRSLRCFDKNNADIILVEGIDENGIGRAIMNRIRKASDEVINVR